MMQIQVNGHAVYAYTGGKPFDATQPTVVFIHGGGFTGGDKAEQRSSSVSAVIVQSPAVDWM